MRIPFSDLPKQKSSRSSRYWAFGLIMRDNPQPHCPSYIKEIIPPARQRSFECSTPTTTLFQYVETFLHFFGASLFSSTVPKNTSATTLKRFRQKDVLACRYSGSWRHAPIAPPLSSLALYIIGGAMHLFSSSFFSVPLAPFFYYLIS